MGRPEPKGEIAIKRAVYDKRSLRIYFASLEASVWLERELKPYGSLSKVEGHVYYFFVSPLFDVEDVIAFVQEVFGDHCIVDP